MKKNLYLFIIAFLMFSNFASPMKFKQIVGLIETGNFKFNVLDLKKRGIGSRKIKKLVEVLSDNEKILSLDLSSNKMSSKSAQYIANLLIQNRVIKKLNLSNTGLKNKGVVFLAIGLQQNNSLEELYLGSNGIDDNGFGFLCKALKNHPTLKKLYLNDNKITLVQKNKSIPKNKKKQMAYFKKRSISTGFADLLQVNNVLEDLDLSSNEVGFNGLYGAAHSLIVNNSLKSLNLIRNKISLKCLELLKDIIEFRYNKGFYSLRYLHLQGNLFGNDKSAELVKHELDDLLSFHMLRYEYSIKSDESVAVKSAEEVIEASGLVKSEAFAVLPEEVDLSEEVDLVLEKMNKFEEPKSRVFTINPPTNLLPLPSGKPPIMQRNEKSLLPDIMPSILTQYIITVRNKLQDSNFNLDECLRHISYLNGFVSSYKEFDSNAVLQTAIDLVSFENIEVIKKGIDLFKILVEKNIGIHFAKQLANDYKYLDDEECKELGLDLGDTLNKVLSQQNFYTGLEYINDVQDAYLAAQDGTSLFMRILGLESIKALIKEGMIKDFLVPCNIAAASFQVKNEEPLSEFNTGEDQIKYKAQAIEIERDAAAGLFRVLLSVYEDAFEIVREPLVKLGQKSKVDTSDYLTYLKLNSYIEKVKAFKNLGLVGIAPIEDLDQALLAAQDDDDLWTRVLGLRSLGQIIENDEGQILEYVYEFSRVLAVTAANSDEIVLREVSFELIKTLFEKNAYFRDDLITDVTGLVESLNDKIKDDSESDEHLELFILRFKRLLCKHGVDNQEVLYNFEYDLTVDSDEGFISEEYECSDFYLTESFDASDASFPRSLEEFLAEDNVSVVAETPAIDCFDEYFEISRQYENELFVEENYNTRAFFKYCENLDQHDPFIFATALKSFYEFLLFSEIEISDLDLKRTIEHINTAVSHKHLLVRFAGVQLFINLLRSGIIDRYFDTDAKEGVVSRILNILRDYQDEFSRKLFEEIREFV